MGFISRLKSRQILTQLCGGDENVLQITPPLCFNRDDATNLVACIHNSLTEIEKNQDAERGGSLLLDVFGKYFPTETLTAPMAPYERLEPPMKRQRIAASPIGNIHVPINGLTGNKHMDAYLAID